MARSASPSACSIRLRLSEVSVESMIASRPSDAAGPVPAAPTPADPFERARALFGSGVSLVVRLVLLFGAGAVMQVGWLGAWTLSYRLTHGNDFTYTYLMTQPNVWSRLMDMLTLGNTLAPGFEMPGFSGPVSLDIVVNSLVMSFVVAGLGYLAAILLVDSGV